MQPMCHLALARDISQISSRLPLAQVALDGFVAYLRDEHQAPESEWTIQNILDGFVQIGKTGEETGKS